MAVVTLAAVVACAAAGAPPPPPAAQYIPLNPQQTLVFIEAENLTATGSSSLWQPRAWAHSPNYFASTVANVFHSRRAHLHHPALANSSSSGETPHDSASASFVVPAAGPYEVLVRYEAPFRFEIPFLVTISQGGKPAFSSVFGRRTNPKVWGFTSGRHAGEYFGCGPGLNTECAWPWGATENMVWEVQTAPALKEGAAEISLTPIRDSDYCCWGDINVDAIMLSPNASDIKQRLNDSTIKDLPFDGMFSQLGEVFFKIENKNLTHNLSVGVPLTYDHALERGYRRHLNGTSYSAPFNIIVPPGGKTEWLEVGGWMDTLDHGSWQVSCSALGPPSPPPANSSECKLNTQKICKIDPNNTKACHLCIAKILNSSSCPDGCYSSVHDTYSCSSKLLSPACIPPPTAQQLKCYDVVKTKCAQNRTGGHAYASNYTQCLGCMKLLPSCPATCILAGTKRCQPAWFEQGCKILAPPTPPSRKKAPHCPKGTAAPGFSAEPCTPIVGAAHCQIVVGVRTQPFATSFVNGAPVYEGEITPVPGRALFDSIETGTEMLFDVNTRATQRMRHNQDDFEEVVAQLKAQGSVPGRPPTIVPIYSDTFPNGSDSGPSGSGPPRLGYATARDAFVNEFCAMNNSCLCDNIDGCDSDPARAATYQNLYLGDYVLAARTQAGIDAGIQRVANLSEDVRHRVGTMKLADEISIKGGLNDSSFKDWCTKGGGVPLTLADLGCTSWQHCPFSPDFANATTNARLYYWSVKAEHESGIAKVKASVDQLRPLLPNALLGANWAPNARYKALDGTARAHNYVGWTFQWINVFRRKALSLPWSEDWIWQTPVGTQQMMSLTLEAMRSGVVWADEPDAVPAALRDATRATGEYVRLKPPQKHNSMLMYVMKHFPGNTNNSWRRQLFSDIIHGVDRFDLFHLLPSTSGYTCDYVDADGGAYPAVRAALNELGNFEDIVHEGRVWPMGAPVALLYSESADIWLSSVDSFASGLRSLYIAYRHAEMPVQILTEDDCSNGRLYSTDMLVITVPNVHQRAAEAISDWVKDGGVVLATASGGLLDEYNQSSSAMEALLGVKQSGIFTGSRQDHWNGTVGLIKQDLRFVDTLDTVTPSPAAHAILRTSSQHGGNASLTCKGVKSIVEVTRPFTSADLLATFTDGSPAAVRSAVGHGQVFYYAWLPGLSYFDTAIPLRPVDRGSTDQNFNHFLPTEFATLAKDMLTLPLAHRLHNDSTVVPIRSTDPLVEIGYIFAPGVGYAFPCVNWAGQASSKFTLTLTEPVAFGYATLASEGAVAVSEDKRSFTFELPVTSDVLVLRL